ncbi:hypothetical protein ACIP4S_27570 [Streptomyces chartreusis]
MALRPVAKTQVVEAASHMVFVSRPGATAALIETAVQEQTLPLSNR